MGPVTMDNATARIKVIVLLQKTFRFAIEMFSDMTASCEDDVMALLAAI